MQTIYIEHSLQDHLRVIEIKRRYPDAHYVICDHYSGVFNKKSQNFRLQKQAPALILARKTGARILSTPESFGIGGVENYYFSHFLNCLYDCRYCFLQGMYQSANYVWFVNHDDFKADIAQICQTKPDDQFYFFSGYDGDSLAFEPVTHFVKDFIPFFGGLDNAHIELRTKSVQIRELLSQTPNEKTIVAFSFTPEPISKAFEHGVPSVAARIDAMKKLSIQGWKLGLRLDPLIDCNKFEIYYEKLLADVFSKIPSNVFHSVSLGTLRFPKKMYDRIAKLYPDEKLLSQPFVKREGVYSYEKEREYEMKNIIRKQLSKYIDSTILFECQV